MIPNYKIIPKIIFKFIPELMGSLMIIHGLLSIAFGIFPLFHIQPSSYEQTLEQLTPLDQLASASAIFSIFLGLAVIFLGLGLLRRKHSAWLWMLILQFFLIANSSFPLLVLHSLLLSIISAILLILFRKEFYVRNAQEQSIDGIIAWISIIFALIYGVTGSYLMRSEFHGIHTLIDAFYFTMVTYSTLGYGDIVPVTQDARLFTTSMIVIGISSFVATLTLIIGPMIQQRVRGVYRIMSKLDSFNNHVVICGFNDLTLITAKELVTQGNTVLFLEKDRHMAEEIKANHFNVIIGDSTHPTELANSNIAFGNILICGYANDAQNILTLMAAHEAKTLSQHPPKFKIICRIEEPHNIEKAKKLGADTVVTPSLLAGQMIATAVNGRQET